MPSRSNVRTKSQRRRQHIPKSQHCLRRLIRKLAKLGKRFQVRGPVTGYEKPSPFLYNRRTVLSARTQLPIQALVGLHRLHKDFNRVSNDYLSKIVDLVPFDDSGVLLEGLSKRWSRAPRANQEPLLEESLRLRLSGEEMLKTAPQLVGLSHCDAPWLTPKTQQLLEEFWEAQGSPNSAEITLLAGACRIRRDQVDDWFIAKKKRLNIFRKEYISQWFSRRLRQRRTARRRKPLMRH